MACSNQDGNLFSGRQASLGFIVKGAIMILEKRGAIMILEKRANYSICLFVAYIFSFFHYIRYIVTITPTRIDKGKLALHKNLNIALSAFLFIYQTLKLIYHTLIK